MNWLSLGLQLLSMRNTFVQTRAVVENAKAAADMAKRTAIFIAFCVLGGIFLLSGIILAIIELGLQADRGELRFSGLLGSSLAFVVLALIIVGVGALVTKPSKEALETFVPPAPPPPVSPEEELKRVGAAVLGSFLNRIKERRDPRDPTSGPGPGTRG